MEGRNIVIEYRWADGHYERLPGLAKELVTLNLDLIVSTGGPSAARATAALGFALLDTLGKLAPVEVQTVRTWLDN
jgi:hypothetical protein